MWQPILMIDGYLMSILGLSMLIPAIYDIHINKISDSPFILSSMVSLFLGIMLFLANRMSIKKISIKQGYLITVISWVSMALLSSIPFIVSGSVDNIIDAWFEAMSGLTTTGGTIFKDVEKVAPSVLLWRSILNALGGIGIVIFAVALLPYLGIGGMQIFQRENSDSEDKFMPKFSYIAKRIIAVYLFLLVVCIVCFHYAGMNWFDAINHGLTTTSTGGLSTKNASFGFFNNVKIELVAIVFMVLGALPMTFYIALLQNHDIHSSRTVQVLAFFKILILYILFVTLWLFFEQDMSISEAFRYASFNVVSLTTGSGFSSVDYLQWGTWCGTVFLLFAFTGGCTGSTTGSIKIFRWQIFFAFIKKSLVGATEPNRVIPVKLGNYPIETNLVSSVFVFFSAYLICLCIFTILLAFTGLDFSTAFSSVVACITNSGPGIVDINGPSGNYTFLTSTGKLICSIAMLVGRLDILTVLVIFTRNFWHN